MVPDPEQKQFIRKVVLGLVSGSGILTYRLRMLYGEGSKARWLEKLSGIVYINHESPTKSGEVVMKKSLTIVAMSLAFAALAAPVVAQNVPTVAPVEGEGLSEGEASIVAALMTAGIVTIGVFAFSGDDKPVSA